MAPVVTSSVPTPPLPVLPAGLLLLADTRFPAGGHSHSAGTESAVAVGDVRDVASLDRYLRARLATSGRVDASFAAALCRTAARGALDAPALARLDVEYSARVPSPYLREVSRRLGRQLCRAATRAWSSPTLGMVAATLGGPHQPLALGAAAAAVGSSPDDAAVLTLHHLAGAVSSAAVRMLGLDPIEVAALQAAATASAADGLRLDLPWDVDDPADLPAASGSLTELLGEHHGSLDARLFVA